VGRGGVSTGPAKGESFWASGLGLIALLTLINLFNYLDRYILVALSPAIKKEFSLSDGQVGMLASAFIVSYLLTAPFFGWWGDRYRRFPPMAIGVALWSLATAACAAAKGFPFLLLARMGVGVGEAAYGAISPSVISDLSPPEKRGKAFALFFVAIPLGSALGYVLGGLLEAWVGWRLAFVLAGGPGLILALALFFAREPKRGAYDGDQANQKAPKAKEAVHLLLQNGNYVLTTLGYCAYTFVLGGVAVWIPHYIERVHNVPAAQGNLYFGGVMIAAGVLGTFLGGAWADRWHRTSADAYLKLSALTMVAAIPLFILVLQAQAFWSFLIAIFFLAFVLFMSTSPVNAQTMASVPVQLRATANAASIFMIHVLGDALSPSIIGFTSDQAGLWWAMHLFIPVLLLGAVIWFYKVILFWEARPWPKGALTLPLYQDHRGAYGAKLGSLFAAHRENSREAFLAALDRGAKMVELDVRLSADGKAVVIHDKDLQRTHGDPMIVASSSTVALKGKGVPLLGELLSDRSLGALAFNIEVKCESYRQPGLEEAVAAAITESQSSGRVIFSSFNPFVLRRLGRLLPEVPRALLVSGEKSPENRIFLRKQWLAWWAQPHMLNLDYRLAGPKILASYGRRDIPVALWTVYEEAEAKKLLAMGAKSIIGSLQKPL
jgi:MFS transporter, Spinster family, sphingosine-1-phosphate transporter